MKYAFRQGDFFHLTTNEIVLPSMAVLQAMYHYEPVKGQQQTIENVVLRNSQIYQILADGGAGRSAPHIPCFPRVFQTLSVKSVANYIFVLFNFW